MKRNRNHISARVESNRVSTNRSPFVSSVSPLMFKGQVLFGALRKHTEKAQARGPDFRKKLSTDGECHETPNKGNGMCHSLFPHHDRIPNRRDLKDTLTSIVHHGGEDMAGERRSAHRQHELEAASHFQKTNQK